MIGQEQLERLGESLRNLGARRLAALAVIGLTVFGAVAVGSYYLSRPEMEPLYVGLEPQDASRISAALRDSGISFDVAPDGSRVSVPYGETARARMLLAEKGLPNNASAGYELFDKLGPVGLTSFMQDITRVRALEGEIARTIQTMNGIKAARVHIVLPDAGSFRRNQQAPSASVIIRTDGVSQFGGAPAIRHLVAAAVPSLTVEQVTVLDTNGTILAAGGETPAVAPYKMVELEQAVSNELQDKVRKTLTPYLGLDNFEISVVAKLNTDKSQTDETIYDPDSRVERSVHNIRESSNSVNADGGDAVTVEQNLPAEQTAALPGNQSRQDSSRRDELSNFELNTKKISTISNGYKVENLTIAVVLNRRQLLASLGQNASQADIDNQLQQVERVVQTAAGVNTERGDRITVAAVDFIAETERLEPVPSLGILDYVMQQSGTYVKALAFVIGTLLLIMLGLKPIMSALLEQPQLTDATTGRPIAIGSAGEGVAALGKPEEEEESGPDFLQKKGVTSLQRLEKAVDVNEEQVAGVLKQWMQS